MADKRMISKKLISSDPFLDMPLTAQGLFFHLMLRADDEGFVDAPNRIVREVQASLEDLEILKEKRYILCFENSNVILIKHWFIHNTIPKDRFTPTVYTDEKAKVMLKCGKEYFDCCRFDNKSYTERIQSVSGTDQILDKNSIEQSIEEKSNESLDFEKAWNNTFGLWPKKNGSATAKQEWVKKVSNAIDRESVATLIYKAVKMYLSDYKKTNNDESMKFVPQFSKWLIDDCDYWVQQYEKQKDGV